MLFLPQAEICLHLSFLEHVSAYFLLLGNVEFVCWGLLLLPKALSLKGLDTTLDEAQLNFLTLNVRLRLF